MSREQNIHVYTRTLWIVFMIVRVCLCITHTHTHAHTHTRAREIRNYLKERLPFWRMVGVDRKLSRPRSVRAPQTKKACEFHKNEPLNIAPLRKRSEQVRQSLSTRKIYICKYIIHEYMKNTYGCIHIYTGIHQVQERYMCMGWLRSVGSIKL